MRRLIRLYLTILFSFSCLAVPFAALGSSPVVCPRDTECQVSIYRSALPSDFAIHNIVFTPPVDGNGSIIPIAGNQVIFRYDGASTQVVCDGSWHDFIPDTSYNEILNRVMCTIGDGGKSVNASFMLYDQDVYSSPYTYCPALGCCPELTGSSKASPYCHTEDDDSACKWQQQNVNNSILNQRNVPLNNWVVYGKTTANNLTFINNVESAAPYSESDYVCAYDTNGNGNIDMGEMGACIQIEQAYFCPVDAADCIATYEDPICPDGSTLNTGTDKCESDPNISCPSGGYIYNSDIDTCATDVNCPDSGGLNPDSDLCEIVVTSDLCPAGHAYNGSLDACIKEVVCAESGIYNSSTDKCEIGYTPACLDGYVYNSSIQKCERDPVCPSGSSYNSTYNKCLKAVASVTCPSGYSYNSSSRKCESSPVCPSGGSYNTGTNRCEAGAGWYCSSNGNTYSSQSTCSSNCAQTAQCTQSTPAVSISGNNWYQRWIRGAYVSGNTLYFRDYDGAFASATFTNTTPSMSSWWNQNRPINKIIASGNQMFLQSCKCTNMNCVGYGMDMTCTCLSISCDTMATVSFTNVTLSGERPYTYPSTNYNGDVICGGGASGNSLRFLGTAPNHYITFTHNAVDVCPLGNYACTGSPMTCTKSGSCLATCPSGYSYSGGICIVNAMCPSGGTLNTSSDKCEYTPTYNCDSGLNYDPAIEYCTGSASCPDSGILNTTADKCQLAFNHSCPADYNYNSPADTCQSDPVCNYGYFDGSIDMCRLSASGICPGTYTYNNDQNKCLVNPPCLSGAAYSTTLNQCSIDAVHDCPDNTSYSSPSRLCEAYPVCQIGSYNADTNNCYEGDNTCPYGPQYACLSYQGKNQCSAQECAQYGSSAQDEGTAQGSNDKHDDGEVDDEGNCLGTVYIFNGHDRRCRSDGATIGFQNCCADEDYLFGLAQCREEEKQLAHLKARGMCHYIGEYCSKTLSLLFTEICIEHSKTYCCFNSKLGKIIQEQGRPQLKTFEGWGQSEGPNCRGMKPEEFEMVDFSRIDLSEWYGDIVAKSQEEISSSMQNKVQTFYDNLEH